MTSYPPTGRSRRRALLIALRTWLLPVALGGAAFGVHYALHIPPGPLPPPSPLELEAKKKAAEKQKREDEKKQKEADKKAGKVGPNDRAGAHDLPYEPFTRPRDRYLLAQLWAYYEPKSFIKLEPVFEAWQTAHKPLISQLVSAARQVVLPGGPAIIVSGSECHTIRCRFTISAPTAEPLQQLSAALEQLQLGGESLWHSYIPGKIVEEPSKREGGEAKQKLELTVSFIRDLPPIARIELPGKGPLRTVPRPQAPAALSLPGSAAAPVIAPAATQPAHPARAGRANAAPHSGPPTTPASK